MKPNQSNQPKIDNPTSAYIHIPFCEKICAYCDFCKVLLEGQPVDAYIDALLKEIQLTKAQFPSSKIETIYIGGGTPTALTPHQLDKLLSGVRELLLLKKENEFTVEANPGDLTADKLQVLKNYGVNRISLGVQTFDDKLLKKIGRKHTIKDVYTTLALLEKADLQNISIDLIYALPNQTLTSFRDTLKQAIALDLPHYSLYSLILENKTMFMNLLQVDKLQLPDQDLEDQMFEETMDQMAKARRTQYEISNFALPGKESRHNLTYWNNEHYYGFGAGASGYLENIRYKNHGPIQHYLKPLKENQLPTLEQEILTPKNQMEEEMFLGLRKRKGVSKKRFQQKFSLPIEAVYGTTIRDLKKAGLLEESADQLFLSTKGLHLGNEVFQRFLFDSET